VVQTENSPIKFPVSPHVSRLVPPVTVSCRCAEVTYRRQKPPVSQLNKETNRRRKLLTAVTIARPLHRQPFCVKNNTKAANQSLNVYCNVSIYKNELAMWLKTKKKYEITKHKSIDNSGHYVIAAGSCHSGVYCLLKFQCTSVGRSTEIPQIPRYYFTVLAKCQPCCQQI